MAHTFTISDGLTFNIPVVEEEYPTREGAEAGAWRALMAALKTSDLKEVTVSLNGVDIEVNYDDEQGDGMEEVFTITETEGDEDDDEPAPAVRVDATPGAFPIPLDLRVIAVYDPAHDARTSGAHYVTGMTWAVAGVSTEEEAAQVAQHLAEDWSAEGGSPIERLTARLYVTAPQVTPGR
jgi:hypothetical protein